MDCPAAPGQVYNIGSTEEISIEDLARRVLEMTKSTSPIQYVSYEQAYGKPFDDMMRRLPSLDRIRKPSTTGPRPTCE